MTRPPVDWSEVRVYYDAGHTRGECKHRFRFSDWDWHAAVGRGDIVPRTKGEPVLASKRRAQILRLRSEGLSYGEISRRLEISKGTVAYHVRRSGVAADDKCAQRYDWSEIQDAYDTGLSVRECAARFGFTKASWSKAAVRGDIIPRPREMPIEELLVLGRTQTNRSHLKARPLQAGLKENRCERCGIDKWMGEPLNVELHHVNGDGDDNRLENLKLFCPNCHAQTDNWGGRGIRRRASVNGSGPG